MVKTNKETKKPSKMSDRFSKKSDTVVMEFDAFVKRYMREEILHKWIEECNSIELRRKEKGEVGMSYEEAWNRYEDIYDTLTASLSTWDSVNLLDDNKVELKTKFLDEYYMMCRNLRYKREYVIYRYQIEAVKVRAFSREDAFKKAENSNDEDWFEVGVDWSTDTLKHYYGTRKSELGM